MKDRIESTGLARQAGELAGIESVSNVIDYGFHVYLGRALTPGDFGIVQSLNAAFLILFTAFSVLQPVVARFVSESQARAGSLEPLAAGSTAVFQRSFGLSLAAGLALALPVLLFRERIGIWLQVPAAAVLLLAPAVFLSIPRPVIAGMLQGLQRFAAYGLTRALFSLGRLLAAVGFIGAGAGLLGAVAAFPAGALAALVGGAALLGGAPWRPGGGLPPGLTRRGFRLSASAFVAFGAHMSLFGSDLLWVQRTFPAEAVGQYAAAVLFRRALALLPGAAVAVLFPRLVARLARGASPDRTLLATSAFVLLSTLALTGVFFAFGPFLASLAFGGAYAQAGGLLGWMGVATVGFNLSTVWLNVFLGTRPGPYVVALVVAAAGELALLARPHGALLEIVAVFGAAGWALAFAGLLLYLLWLRPRLRLALGGVDFGRGVGGG